MPIDHKVGLQGHPTGLTQSSVSENVLKANVEAVYSFLKYNRTPFSDSKSLN